MLDANQVSIWLGGMNSDELICSHVLDGHGRLGRVCHIASHSYCALG